MHPICVCLGESAIELVMEMLQFLRCDFTQSVFTKETNYSTTITRDKLVKKLGIKENVDPKKPLLLHILLRGGGSGGVEEGRGGGIKRGGGGGIGGGIGGGLIGGIGGGIGGGGLGGGIGGGMGGGMGGMLGGGLEGGKEEGRREEGGGKKGQEKVSFKDDKLEKNTKPGQQESQKSTSITYLQA